MATTTPQGDALSDAPGSPKSSGTHRNDSVGAGGQKTPPAGSFEDSTQPAGGQSTRFSLLSLRRMRPASPLISIKGKLSRRGRSSSGGDIIVPPADSDAMYLSPDSYVSNTINRYTLREGYDSTSGGGAGDSDHGFFGESASSADLEGPGVYSDEDEAAGSSSTTSGTRSTITSTTNAQQGNKASTFTKLRKLSSNVNKKQRTQSGGEVLSLGRGMLERESSYTDESNSSGKSPLAVHGRTAVSSPDYPASSRKMPSEWSLGVAAPARLKSPPVSSNPSSPGAGGLPPPYPPSMKQGTTVPLSHTSFGINSLEAAGFVASKPAERSNEMPRAQSEAVRPTSPLGRGRRAVRGTAPGRGRCKSDSPTASSKGQRAEGSERSMTPPPRPTASRIPSPGGGPGAGDSIGSARPSPERRGLWSALQPDVFRSAPGMRSILNSTPLSKSPPPSLETGLQVSAEWSSRSILSRHSRRHSSIGLLKPPLGDCVVKTPPSVLKYGDRLRLWARAAPPGGNLADVKEGGTLGTPQGGGVSMAGGGYVGFCTRVHRVHQKLLRRSELVVIGAAEEEGGEFVDCHFTAVDPEEKRKDGDQVHFGEVILLVEDEDKVWNENVHGPHVAGSLRMKRRGSKKQIGISFKLPEQGIGPKLTNKGERPVLFGSDPLQIVAEDLDSTRKRKSRKRNNALTAYSKKGLGNGVVAGACLCMDGRGEQVVFEVHLPKFPKKGDPSPVVTKVTIYSDDRKALPPPPPHPTINSRGEYSSGSTGSTATMSTDSVGSHASIGRSSSAPRVVSPTSSTSSWNSSTKEAAETVPVEHAQAIVSPHLPSVENDEPQTERGAFEGLKWGEHIGLRMPSRHEALQQNDVVMTMRLSNGMSASVTSELLKAKTELGEFPVEASMTRRGTTAGTEQETSTVTGTVYLKCRVSPLVCPHAEARRSSKLEPEKDAPEGWKRWINAAFGSFWDHGVLPLLPATLRQTFVQSDVEMEKEGDRCTGGQASATPNNAAEAAVPLKTGKTWLSRSALLFFVAVATMVGTRQITSRMVFVRRNLSLHEPCTSIWDLRQPDGSAYPRHQLAAAVAAFEAAGGSVPGQDERPTANGNRGLRQGQHLSRQSTGSGESRGALHELSLSDTDAASPMKSASTKQARAQEGGWQDARVADSPNAQATNADFGFAELTTPTSKEGRTGGISRSSNDASPGRSSQSEFPLVWGLSALGSMSRTAKAWLSFGLAAVAFVALTMSGLFGWGMGQVNETEDRPMQAEVYLMRYDDRRLSEAAAVDNRRVEDVYFDPPEGSDLAPMPYRFLLAENMDTDRAWQRWEATLAWRKENDADNVLSKPHPKFSLIKSKYVHCFHMPDKDGRLTYYERPGQSELGELKKLGVSKQELIDHYIYCMEYLWQVLQPEQTQRITIVIDLAGVKFMDLVGEAVAFLKTSVSMMSRHYPQRSFKILILNAPSFFNQIFAVIKPMLNEATKKKIDLLPVANAGVEMLKIIPSESLPPHYGGTCETPLMESPAEAALLAHTQKVLRDSKLAMETMP